MSKNLTFVTVLTVLTVALGVGIRCAGGEAVKCRPIRLVDGTSRLQRQGRLVRLRCLKGYELVGRRYMSCFRGQWDFQRDPSISYPMCVKPGCRASSYVNGLFLETYKGAVVNVVCNLGYKLVGSSTVYCNGQKWNQAFPECKAKTLTPQRSCNFEVDLCDWSQEPLGDWLWWNRSAPQFGVGPPYEDNNSGRYMLLGNSSSRIADATERIFSPVFPQEYSNGSCFTFWYLLHGRTSGHLKVYVKREGEELSGTIPPFWVNGDQGSGWKQGYFPVYPSNEPFQIIIEGKSLSGGESETAFDDVNLAFGEECDNLREMFTTTESSSSTSAETTDDDDDDSLSCKNRCNQDAVVPHTNLTATDLQENPKCDCHVSCLRTNSCCADFRQFCPRTATTTTTTTTTEATLEITSTSSVTESTSDEIRGTDRTTTRTKTSAGSSSDGSSAGKSEGNGPIFEPKTAAATTTTTARPKNDKTKLPPSRHPSHPTSGDNDPQRVVQSESGRPSEGVPAGVIEAIVAVVLVFVSALVVFAIIRRRKRRKTEKESMVEDSDVRFLTSDEFLDFTLAHPADDDL